MNDEENIDRRRFWKACRTRQFMAVFGNPRNCEGLEADFLAREIWVTSKLRELGLDRYITGISLPIDYRVVQPVAPEGYLEKEKAIDHLHCDPWRGEPSDGVNGIYYIDAGVETPKTELYAPTPEEIERFRSGPQEVNCRKVKYNPGPGDFLLFDAFVPHRALRRGSKNRISLNFTLRRRDPYEVIDERWHQPQQNWSKYWYFPAGNFNRLEARLEWEIDEIWKRHPYPPEARRLVELRQKYVDDLKGKLNTPNY